jgi:hypothetical protein
MIEDKEKFINDLKLSIVAGFTLNAYMKAELTDNIDEIAKVVLDDVEALGKEKDLVLDKKMRELIYDSIVAAIGLNDELKIDRSDGKYEPDEGEVF